MLLVSTTRIIPGRAVPSFLSGRYPAVKVRKKLYVTKRQGYTQVELAGLCGVGVTYLSHLEGGKETAEIGKALHVVAMLGVDLFAKRRG